MRLRTAAKIAINSTTYGKQIEALRSDNADLRVIGSYGYRQAPRQVRKRSSPPAEYGQIRNANQALHSALQSVWCCENLSHIEHAAKLCLRAKIEDGVRLELAVSCSKSRMDSNTQSDDAPLWLYVRSLTNTLPVPSLQRVRTTEHANLSAAKRARLVSQTPILPTGKDLRKSNSLCDSLAMCTCLARSEECPGLPRIS